MINMVLLINENKLHRGYRDRAGLFTLEKDNLDQAEKLAYFEAPEVGDTLTLFGGLEYCGNCFPEFRAMTVGDQDAVPEPETT